jgi:hypothetical protein
VVNDPSELLIFATPALASAAVAGTAWWTRSVAVRVGRTVAASAARAAVQRWIPVALVVLISVTIGVLAYLGRALEVSSDRALHGAVIAALATAMALGIYWALGIVARRAATVVGLWALSLVPLYLFGFFAWIAVARYTQCGPQAYECPV